MLYTTNPHDSIGRLRIEMTHFVQCSKTLDASKVSKLYFNDIVKLYIVPKTVESDRDVRFMSYFWKNLWRIVGTKL
jgi:hypothetical protein